MWSAETPGGGTRLSHEVLHDAVKSKDMATGGDLGAQGVGLQGYRALHLATCHHHHLPNIKPVINNKPITIVTSQFKVLGAGVWEGAFEEDSKQSRELDCKY